MLPERLSDVRRQVTRLLDASTAEFKARHVALGLLLGGVASSPVHAQQATVEPINEISLTADLRHDSNVVRASDIFGVQQGFERSDQRLQVGAALNLARPFGPHSVALEGFIGYDFYRRNTELNRERIRLAGNAQFDAGICQIGLLPRFERQQSSLYDLAAYNLPGIEAIRNTETVHSYRGELRCGNPQGIRPLVYYDRSFGNNSNVLRKQQDYRGETFGGGLSYANPVLGQFDLSVERTKMKYPRRPVVLGLTGYRLDKVKLATSRDIGAILQANGYIAYTRLKPDDTNTTAFNGLSWSLGLTAVPVTDVQITARLGQDIQPSLGNDALFSRDREWQLSATYQLGVRTSVTGSYYRSERLYRGATARFGPLLTNDKLDQVSGRFNFSPGDRLTLGLEVGHERRDANGTFYDYKNTYVAFSTRFTLGAF